jgi:cobalt-zinc-cadmium efflux system outer membrane protein
MLRKRLFVFLSLVIVSGCLWPVREKTDREVGLQIAHPFDVAPEQVTTVRYTGASKDNVTETPAVSSTTPATHSFPSIDVETTSFMQATEPARPAAPPHLDLKIPGELPGAEAPLIQFPKDRAAKDAEIRRIYPALPALPEEPKALPGPDGHPYTLSELQRIAAENSPTLRQAASDVEAAKGNVIAARAYPNPTVGLENDPSNNGSTAGVYGMFVDQPIKTGGKLKLQSASAEMDLANAELALRRARSDLSTGVRNAYYGLVVAQETVRVNRSLARFTDEIYRLQAQLLEGGFAAAYEPAALRAQAYTARLAYKQSIASYVYAWKQLVSTVGLRQLPLSEVAGRVDRLIPAFEYDSALARVLQSHTDVLTARNAVEKARYNLKLQQVTPVPDVDVRLAVLKETAIAPFNWRAAANLGPEQGTDHRRSGRARASFRGTAPRRDEYHQ